MPLFQGPVVLNERKSVQDDSSSPAGPNEDSSHLYRRFSKESDEEKAYLSENRNDYVHYLYIFHIDNIAIFLSYFSVGFALSFTATPTQYYMVNSLQASAVSMGVYSTFNLLPWSFKLFYGLLSDNVSIFGYRRKPYLIFGWSVFVLLNVILSSFAKPSIVEIIILSSLSTAFYMMADVSTDAIAVERSMLENSKMKGHFQTVCYTFRSGGQILGAVGGTCLYNAKEWGWGLTISQVFLINAIFVMLLVLPLSYFLIEIAPKNDTPEFNIQISNIWETMKLQAVWKPFIFFAVYQIMQVPNQPWNNFLIDGLHFSNFQIGVLQIIGTLLTLSGLLVYKYCLFNSSWRILYIICALLSLLFDIIELTLVYRLNLKIGLPDFLFSMGDSTVLEFIKSIQFMPSIIMFTLLCPFGAEGTAFALLTSINNVYLSVAGTIGSSMAKIWDTSNKSFAMGKFDGLANLTILTSVLQIVPIVLVFLLPNNKEDHIKMRDEGKKSWWGGFILLMSFFLSSVFTILYSSLLLLNEEHLSPATNTLMDE